MPKAGCQTVELVGGPYDGSLWDVPWSDVQIRIWWRESKYLGQVSAIYTQADFGVFAFVGYSIQSYSDLPAHADSWSLASRIVAVLKSLQCHFQRHSTDDR